MVLTLLLAAACQCGRRQIVYIVVERAKVFRLYTLYNNLRHVCTCTAINDLKSSELLAVLKPAINSGTPLEVVNCTTLNKLNQGVLK